MAAITAENLKEVFLKDYQAQWSTDEDDGGIPSLSLYALMHTLFNLSRRTQKMVESSELFFSRLEREKTESNPQAEDNLLVKLKLQQKIREEKYGISQTDDNPPQYRLMEDNPYAQRALHFHLKRGEFQEWFQHPDTRIIADILEQLYQNTFVLQHHYEPPVPFHEMLYEVGYFPLSPQSRERWLNRYSEQRHPAYMLLHMRLEETYLNAISQAFPRPYKPYRNTPEDGYQARESLNLDRYADNEIPFTPETLDVASFNETKWNLLSSDQQKVVFMLAFASFNTSLLLKISEFSGNPLFELVKKSHPFVVYHAFQMQQMSLALIEVLQNTLIQCQNDGILKDWGINPLYRNERLMDMLLDFYGKMGFLDNLMTLIADKIHTYEVENGQEPAASETFDTLSNMVSLNEYI